ncbi:MAG: hypothetical protein KGY75_09875 [Candidatus Cloacimonetes bacterium]|nr:hypothetical protein [Candidatus Cloacimonadota bacterium]MBS3768409.1 hypothetical protein [Candidatus Cloacimonadota bacterium]
MKKIIALLVLMIISTSLFAAYQVGDVVDDFTWTDNTSTTHSIYDLIDSEKIVLFFWGGPG